MRVSLLPTHCKQEDSLSLAYCPRNNESLFSFSSWVVVVVVIVADWLADF